MSLSLRGGMLEDFAGEIKCLCVFHQSLDDSCSEVSFSLNLSVCDCLDLRINDSVLLR